MECSVCLNDWDAVKCIPKMLACGHSFCQKCLHDLLKVKRGQATLVCPTCMLEHSFSGGKSDVDKLIKNFTLISLSESHCKHQAQLRKDQHSPDEGTSLSHKSKKIAQYRSRDVDAPDEEVKNRDSSKDSEEQAEENIPTVKFNEVCPSHKGQLLVAYNKNSKGLLCNTCINDDHLLQSQYEVFPQVVTLVKEKIESARTMIYHRKLQLQQAKKHIKTTMESNRQKMQGQLTHHIERLMLFFEEYKRIQKNNMEEALMIQQTRVEQVNSEIEEFLTKLENDSQNLSSIECHEDQIIIFMNDIIDELRQGLIQFNPQINFHGLQVTMEVTEPSVVLDKINKILNQSLQLF